MTEELKQAAQAALEALEEIALAGMSGTGQESEEGLRDWHARQAWKFIGIAARALDPLRTALTQRPAAQTERWIVAAVDAAMVEMKNISPPLRRSECERLIRAAAEYMPAPQQATPEPVGEPRQFPVLKGKTLFSVPWSMLVPHERQARANHGQSLERLAERGGLSPVEMVAVVLGKRWRDVEGMSAADAEASLSKMVTAQTRPAPGVPEGFTLDQIADACVQAEISDSKFESLVIALAAAQAKGAGHE